jgi:hypothetical protein
MARRMKLVSGTFKKAKNATKWGVGKARNVTTWGVGKASYFLKKTVNTARRLPKMARSFTKKRPRRS